MNGVARTATYEQVKDLLNIVEKSIGYRDWGWLDYWLEGGPAMQHWTPDAVIKLYTNNTYWAAVQAGDLAEVDNIRNAILGTH